MPWLSVDDCSGVCATSSFGSIGRSGNDVAAGAEESLVVDGEEVTGEEVGGTVAATVDAAETVVAAGSGRDISHEVTATAAATIS